LGGKSPIVPETEKQAAALLEKLKASEKGAFKVFINMRYWHPFADEVVKQVKNYAPDRIILLPLYPQYSATTTESSVNNFMKYYHKAGLKIPCKIIKDYPDHPLLIEAHAEKIFEALKGGNQAEYRIIFSAHGLPKKIVDKGDIYPEHIARTCGAIVKILGNEISDYVISYQSRVGRLEWIGPSTDDEILRAAKDGKKIVIVPVAFVSEHSETLVELDIEYKELAEEAGIKDYIRIKTLSCDDKFMECLKMLVLEKCDD
jgi:ferrochelatase